MGFSLLHAVLCLGCGALCALSAAYPRALPGAENQVQQRRTGTIALRYDDHRELNELDPPSPLSSSDWKSRGTVPSDRFSAATFGKRGVNSSKSGKIYDDLDDDISDEDEPLLPTAESEIVPVPPSSAPPIRVPSKIELPWQDIQPGLVRKYGFSDVQLSMLRQVQQGLSSEIARGRVDQSVGAERFETFIKVLVEGTASGGQVLSSTVHR